jgi:hypothetical protein
MRHLELRENPILNGSWQNMIVRSIQRRKPNIIQSTIAPFQPAIQTGNHKTSSPIQFSMLTIIVETQDNDRSVNALLSGEIPNLLPAFYKPIFFLENLEAKGGGWKSGRRVKAALRWLISAVP